jgi:nucleoside-triphosphatase THEP1
VGSSADCGESVDEEIVIRVYRVSGRPDLRRNPASASVATLMESVSTNFLVTGPPRCGKSTLIEAVVRLIHRPARGFFTRETLDSGRRTGFEIITLSGSRGVLAHENLKSRIRVGRYGVNLDDLERVAVPAMIPSDPGEIVVIDEIGKMECFSALFRSTLLSTLASPNVVIGSIAFRGNSFIEQIKKRPDVKLFQVTEQNRNSLAKSLADPIRSASTGSLHDSGS